MTGQRALSMPIGRTDVSLLPFVQPDPTQVDDERMEDIKSGVFTFNGERHVLAAGFDWQTNPSGDIEWHILLHKFYYTVGLASLWQERGDRQAAHCAIDLIDRWILADIPAGYIAADVTGRRLQNWIYTWSLLKSRQGGVTLSPGFEGRLRDSIESQTRWLVQNLHTARNHRTLELYAVLLVSLGFPEFSESDAWRELAIQELEKNALADFRSDGGHCEQSTHYHCLALTNFLNAVCLMQAHGLKFSESANARLALAVQFAAAIHRPDGEIAAFSDADGGAYRTLIHRGQQVFSIPQNELEPATRIFRSSGYAVLRSEVEAEKPAEDQRWLMFDAGPLGEGNHGHFDLLSLEAFAYGKPLIVDPGRYTYDERGPVNWRAKFRSTEAHSTIEVDGKNQTLYRPGPKKMKIGGPAPQHALHFSEEVSGLVHVRGEAISAEYDAVHRRDVALIQNAYWLVIDQIRADTEHAYRLRWQLAPHFQDSASLISRERSCEVQGPGLTIITAADQALGAELEDGFVSRRYGEKSLAPRLCARVGARDCLFYSVIYPWTGAQPSVALSYSDNTFTISHATPGSEMVDAVRWQAQSGVLSIHRTTQARSATGQPGGRR